MPRKLRLCSALSPRAQPFDPYKQGRLDGLCGIYATVNAMHLLCAEFSEHDAINLFHDLLLSLDYRGATCADRAAFGIEPLTLPRVLRTARTFMRNVFDLNIIVAPIKEEVALDRLWHRLRVHTEQQGVAIIGLTGQHDHWTVVRRATPRLLFLSDSGDLHRLQRRFCSVAENRARHRIDPLTVYLLHARERGVRL
jgi:hypothetical protein